MTKTQSCAKNHVLIFPFPAQGHMIPLLDLAHHLYLGAASSLDLTIFVTPKNLHFLSPLLSVHPSIQTLVLPFPSHPSIPMGIENAKDLSPGLLPAMIHALGFLRQPLLDWAKAHPHPPSFIISDIFLGWTRRLGIPRIAFSPSAAMTICVLNSLWTNMPVKPGCDENNVLQIHDVPNRPKYPWKQVSGLYRSYMEGDSVSGFLKEVFRDNISSWGMVINTFDAMEKVYLDDIKQKLHHDRVWAVGPITPFSRAGRGGANSVPEERVMKWLEDIAGHGEMVVYVCFGSQVVLSRRQVETIASALEKSGVNFIWVVKEAIVNGQLRGSVPAEFEDRVSGRGMVIRGWAPQIAILNHSAVGVFLTHCGWNSVMESVCAGLVLLTWPMGADQFIDATLTVEQLKLGIRVSEGADSVPDPDKLAEVLAASVSENIVERVKAAELKKEAVEAVTGGSSTEELVGMIRCLSGVDAQNQIQNSILT